MSLDSNVIVDIFILFCFIYGAWFCFMIQILLLSLEGWWKLVPALLTFKWLKLVIVVSIMEISPSCYESIIVLCRKGNKINK